MKYLKLFVNFNNCVPALIGQSMQATFSDMDLCRLCVMLLREGVEVVRSARIDMVSLPGLPRERISSLASLPIDDAASILGKTLTGLSREPLYGSILQSILRGKSSEIDFINGEVVRLADRGHALAPLNRRVVDMVHEVERTGKFFSADEVKAAFELH
jgi:2-dehydropantoate 2-reductase